MVVLSKEQAIAHVESLCDGDHDSYMEYDYVSNREQTIMTDFVVTHERFMRLIDRYFVCTEQVGRFLFPSEDLDMRYWTNRYFGDFYSARDVVKYMPAFTKFLIKSIGDEVAEGSIRSKKPGREKRYINQLEALHARFLKRCAKHDPVLYAYHHAS